jgi:hypothetical protein
MMTTSSEDKPKAIDWAGHDAWREAVVVARRARRQRSERYVARHRRAPDDVRIPKRLGSAAPELQRAAGEVLPYPAATAQPAPARPRRDPHDPIREDAEEPPVQH